MPTKLNPINRTVVVTGASSGIGKYAAETLSKYGYKVIATVRKEADKDKLNLAQGSHSILLDLSSSDSVQTAVKQIKHLANGDLYALFNNGAYGQPGAVEDVSRDVLRQQFETNLFGTHELTVSLLPELLKQESARIIQCSSVLGFIPLAMRGAYVSSKFALDGLTKTLRMELNDTNVRVSLIEPGPIATEFRKNALMALQNNIDFSASRHGWRYQAAFISFGKRRSAFRVYLRPGSRNEMRAACT